MNEPDKKSYDRVLSLERIVIEDAKKTAEKMVSNAKAEEKKALADARAAARAKADKYERRRRAEIDAKYSDILNEYRAACRVELIKKRDDIQKNVFEKLERMLRGFISSDEYEKYIGDKLEKFDKSALSDDILVIVSDNDTDFKAVAAAFPNAKTEVSDSIKLAGCIICDRSAGIMYDLTLDSGFEHAKSEFPAVSGLRISDQGEI